MICGDLTDDAPEWWPTLHTSNDDTRGLTWALDLGPLTDTIVSVTGVIITRQDGTAMGSGDLALLQQPTIDSTGLIVSMWLGSGFAGVVYQVSTTILTAQSRTLSRDRLVLVAAPLF